MDIKSELSKLFATGSKKERKSIYMHKPLIDALDFLSEKTGKDFSELVCLFLDKELTDMVASGLLEAPNNSVDNGSDKAKVRNLKTESA